MSKLMKSQLVKSGKVDTKVVSYDSTKIDKQGLISLIRKAHRENHGPFQAIAVANHGPPQGSSEWCWTVDLSVDLTNAQNSIDALAPINEALIAALEKTNMNVAHIDFLACRLASIVSEFVPTLEELYHVDFRASTDDTGNQKDGGNWKLETDEGYDFSNEFLDGEKVERFRGTCRGPFFIMVSGG